MDQENNVHGSLDKSGVDIVERAREVAATPHPAPLEARQFAAEVVEGIVRLRARVARLEATVSDREDEIGLQAIVICGLRDRVAELEGADEWVECDGCEGSGRTLRNEYIGFQEDIPCPECQGRGRVRAMVAESEVEPSASRMLHGLLGGEE